MSKRHVDNLKESVNKTLGWIVEDMGVLMNTEMFLTSDGYIKLSLRSGLAVGQLINWVTEVLETIPETYDPVMRPLHPVLQDKLTELADISNEVQARRIAFETLEAKALHPDGNVI